MTMMFWPAHLIMSVFMWVPGHDGGSDVVERAVSFGNFFKEVQREHREKFIHLLVKACCEEVTVHGLLHLVLRGVVCLGVQRGESRWQVCRWYQDSAGLPRSFGSYALTTRRSSSRMACLKKRLTAVPIVDFLGESPVVIM